jgi:hypothetical protein
MTTDSKALAIIPRTVDEVRNLAKMFAQSSLLPPDLRGKEADVFVSIMAGQELGLPPMAALRGVHVVKGKPVLSADTMVGIVLGSGLAEYFACVKESSDSVTYETKRKGSPHSQCCTWSMVDAQLAGLGGGDNWRKYPRAMLKARCKAMLARDVYPDVLAGCYDDDEAREFTGPRPMPPAADVIDAEFTDAKQEPSEDPLAFIDAAETTEALRELAPRLSKMPEGDMKTQARARYRQRMHRLTQATVDATTHEGAA